MQRTKIEWTDYTWNPIKGICPVGCWYCYAKKIYQRFLNDKYFGADLFLDVKDLFKPEKLKKLSKIFVCSTIDLFHPDVTIWANQIFEIIEKCPQHTFQILTKLPQNVDRPMPDNVWLGVSITSHVEHEKAYDLMPKTAKIKFISFEPLLDGYYHSVPLKHFDWVIVGRLTGYGNKYDPKKYWVQQIADQAKHFNIPIFLKNNLKDIWGEPLIQEFPCVG